MKTWAGEFKTIVYSILFIGIISGGWIIAAISLTGGYDTIKTIKTESPTILEDEPVNVPAPFTLEGIKVITYLQPHDSMVVMEIPQNDSLNQSVAYWMEADGIILSSEHTKGTRFINLGSHKFEILRSEIQYVGEPHCWHRLIIDLIVGNKWANDEIK